MRNKGEIKKVIEESEISRASFATISSQGVITAHNEFTEDVVFQCASLSKPVFAYLTLKLIELNKTKPSDKEWAGKFKTKFTLDTPLYKIFGNGLEDSNNHFLKKFSTKSREPNGLTHQQEAKELTARMVLSHTSGLPIVGKEPFQFQFPPGTHYNYSGPGIECLQEVIEELTLPSLELLAIRKEAVEMSSNSSGNHLSSEQNSIKTKSLETLAQEHIFRKEALDMPNSTFGDKPSGANSLKTTAQEYAKFILAWINDPLLNSAFFPVKPANSMMNDYFPNPKAVGRFVENVQVKNADRELVAWGLGVGLVKNNDGKIIGIYHTGDMGNDKVSWRAGFGATINPETGECTGASVYLTQSKNGHMLADLVLPVALKPALDYFFPTYGFARNNTELHGTNFHGLNPAILKKHLQEDAGYEIPKSFVSQESSKDMGSIGKMYHLMAVNPSIPKPRQIEKSESQKQKEGEKSLSSEAEQKKEEATQEEFKFNPTPLSYKPDK